MCVEHVQKRGDHTVSLKMHTLLAKPWCTCIDASLCGRLYKHGYTQYPPAEICFRAPGQLRLRPSSLLSMASSCSPHELSEL